MRKITFYLFVLGLFTACQSDTHKAEMLEKIKILQKEVGESQQPQPEKLIELQNAFTLYADAFPQDSLSAKYLTKASETAKVLRQFDKAMELCDKIIKTYPGTKEEANAMFMKAFMLDNDLKKLDEAKMAYEAFLKKYPNDDFSDDAQFLLNNLGKSPEEIIKGFENKANEAE